MFKLLKTGYEIGPKTYNYFASKSKLSEKRKNEIEERRSRLKIAEDNPKVLRIVIEEMLAYKPGLLTLDDRYLQLEQILDAIDKAKITKEVGHLINLCEEIASEISVAPGKFKNAFLECLENVNGRIKAELGSKLKAKL